MRNVTLTRISSTHSRLRTNDVVGFTMAMPEVGNDFVMYAPALVEGDFRLVSTTTVESAASVGKTTYFKTANSKYMLVDGGEVVG